VLIQRFPNFLQLLIRKDEVQVPADITEYLLIPFVALCDFDLEDAFEGVDWVALYDELEC
jgi:hypothetical protein